MDLVQLQQFKTIAKTGSISAAAEIMNISQSGLSKSLQRLEYELGVDLFYRKKRSVSITPAGEIFLEHTKAILHQLEQAKQSLKNYPDIYRKIRVICCSHAIAWNISKTFNSNPESCLIIPKVHNNIEKARAELLDREIDLAIMSDPPESKNIEWKLYFIDHMYICASYTSPFAKKKSVLMKELNGLSFSVLGSSNYWSDYLRKKLPNSTFNLYSDSVTLYSVIGTKDNYGITTDLGESFYSVPNGVKIMVLDADAHYYIGYLKENKHKLQPVVDMLCSGTPDKLPL